MFKIFGKTKKVKIQESDYEFLRAVIQKLPSKYAYLSEQISEDFILGKKVNELGDVGTYTLSLNANLEKKFSNKKLPHFFILKNILIWDNAKKKYIDIELHILEGMLAGFMLTSDYKDLDFNKIDTSHITEKNFQNTELEELKSIIGKNIKKAAKYLDIEDTFKIEIPEGNFYVIKNLGDGNYLSVTKKGQVYGMIHDPYELELLFEKIADFINALEKNEFNISDYYESKMK